MSVHEAAACKTSNKRAVYAPPHQGLAGLQSLRRQIPTSSGKSKDVHQLKLSKIWVMLKDSDPKH